MKGLFFLLTLFLPLELLADDTILKLYRPFSKAYASLSDADPADCFQQSELIKREDAWRCQNAKGVYDPCFINIYTEKKEAYCPQSPWQDQAVKMPLNQMPDASMQQSLDMSSALPWALVLDDGTHCLAVTTDETVDGLKVHYHCDKQMRLLGNIQRCHPAWTILAKQKQKIDFVGIHQAWF